MTTAALGIFAEMYNWIDGLFSCSIMCILSGVYGLITIFFGISFIKNDEDSDDIKVIMQILEQTGSNWTRSELYLASAKTNCLYSRDRLFNRHPRQHGSRRCLRNSPILFGVQQPTLRFRQRE